MIVQPIHTFGISEILPPSYHLVFHCLLIDSYCGEFALFHLLQRWTYVRAYCKIDITYLTDIPHSPAVSKVKFKTQWWWSPDRRIKGTPDANTPLSAAMGLRSGPDYSCTTSPSLNL